MKLSSLVSGAFLGVVITLLILEFLLSPENTTLQKLRWEELPNLLVIPDFENEEKEKGLFFLRLEDGKSDFLKGTWNFNFSFPSSGLAYEKTIDSQKNRQTLYHFYDARDIFIIELSDLSRPILNVEENPARTYFLVQFQTAEKNASFCFAARIGDEKHGCSPITIRGLTAQALWNPKKDREAIFRRSDGTLFTVDPWDMKPQEIAEDNGDFRNFDRLFEKNRKRDAPPFWWIKLFNFVLAKNKEGWSITAVPFFSRAEELSDGKHLFIRSPLKLSVLELGSKKMAFVFAHPKLKQYPIRWKNSTGNQSL